MARAQSGLADAERQARGTRGRGTPVTRDGNVSRAPVRREPTFLPSNGVIKGHFIICKKKQNCIQIFTKVRLHPPRLELTGMQSRAPTRQSYVSLNY